jgi:hypothetical protein
MDWTKLNLSPEVDELLTNCPKVTVASTTEELSALACGGPASSFFEVAYDVPGKGHTVEATVTRVRNGLTVNYPEPYMRRRDPNCLFIGDDQPTDKETYEQHFGQSFGPVREAALAWLKSQELVVFGFIAGRPGMGLDAVAVVPANASFFALSLAMLQGVIPYDQLSPLFKPRAIIYVAPIFRHTLYAGKQVVIHNRQPNLYEMFAFNLYPGPSAKKGVYGMLLDLGEREGWVVAHCSTAQVITPYDNMVVIMHEGASGGGKSEMLEQAHREPDGRLVLGENLVTGETRYLEIPRSCEVHPVSDDMALCHPSLQDNNGKLRVTDAEDAWFVRVNHINNYGTDTNLERLTAKPNRPLLFLNIEGVPGGRSLIWEHIMDAPDKPCPNPRVIIPRHVFPDVVDAPVSVDIRSFGVRTPPCTREEPSYGIIGLFHLLPPALAWLWRLVAPRGYENPSIVDSEKMGTEGVGAFWPFATGRRVAHANLLLNQFSNFRRTRHILIPNQHIGAWKVGFMPEWVAREYLARRGVARFRPDQMRPSRSPLLGYTLHQLHVEGHMITRWFLEVNTQPEVGDAAYDVGAEMLYDFFRQNLADFMKADLSPLGKHIIRCCLDRGKLEDYEVLIPME